MALMHPNSKPALASAYYMNAVKTPSEARAGILHEAKHIGDIDGLPTH